MKEFLGTCPKEGLRGSAYWGLSVMWRKGLHEGGRGSCCLRPCCGHMAAGASCTGGKKKWQAISRLGLGWALWPTSSLVALSRNLFTVPPPRDCSNQKPSLFLRNSYIFEKHFEKLFLTGVLTSHSIWPLLSSDSKCKSPISSLTPAPSSLAPALCIGAQLCLLNRRLSSVYCIELYVFFVSFLYLFLQDLPWGWPCRSLINK